jgi:hypothetical protein
MPRQGQELTFAGFREISDCENPNTDPIPPSLSRFGSGSWADASQDSKKFKELNLKTGSLLEVHSHSKVTLNLRHADTALVEFV